MHPAVSHDHFNSRWIWPTLIGAAALFALGSVTHAAATGNSPKLFGEGVISGPADDRAPTFSPDGNTVFFGRGNPSQFTVLVSHRIDGSWSEPEIAPFSGCWRDLEPSMAPDGSYLIFASNRPASKGGKPLDGHYGGKVALGKGGNLWRVDRVGSGWSDAHRLPDSVNVSDSVFAPTISSDGTLYFMHPDAQGNHFHLFRSAYSRGSYQPATPAGLDAGGTAEVDPAVAPDESFIIFSSRSPEHPQQSRLFIAFRDNQNWNTPIDLGDEVNEEGDNNEARLGADHRSLYFSTNTVEPVTYPSTRELTASALARMLVRDNGNDNIWTVSLAPWLDRRAGNAAARTSRSDGRLHSQPMASSAFRALNFVTE